MSKIYDISRPISARTVVWPGDATPDIDWSARIEEGSSVNVGVIRLSTHTATHADAPLHYMADGHAVDAYDLDVFVGEATLVDVSGMGVLGGDVLDLIPAGATRVLFRTGHSEVGDHEWRDDFASFAADLIDRLAERGVKLIGTDAPSVDPAASTELPAHHALARHGIANLENLQLSGVPVGTYELIALPLSIVGADASPVRAILRELPR